LEEKLVKAPDAFVAMQAAAVAVKQAADKWGNLADQVTVWAWILACLLLALIVIVLSTRKAP
jgi:hypothetical protein